ncbi:MAG: hypothetical protein ABEJ07_01065 [Candidatus Nanohaloarchaea archaeon]
MDRKIGEGLQYRVYREGGGLARKEPKKREEMVETLRKWHDSRQEVQENADRAVERRRKAVERLEEGGFDFSLLGDPEFCEDGTVLQDRAQVAGEVMSGARLSKKKEVVDDYVQLLLQLWEQGIGDTIYNFTENTGYVDGRLVHLDFGELVFSKNRVKEEIRERKWLEKWSYTDDLSGDIRPYFRERMAEEITVEALESRWKEKV